MLGLIKLFKSLYFAFTKSKNYLHNYILLKRKKVSYKTFPKINGKLFITGNGTLVLGEDVKLNSGLRANPIGGDTKLILDLGQGGYIEIGDKTGISNATIIGHKKIIIGKNVKIGGNVKIYDTDFHSLNYLNRRKSEDDIPNNKGITIDDDVFIGAHSILLKGINIGEKAIIGSGSVVTKSISPSQIWGGNPAKFIKGV